MEQAGSSAPQPLTTMTGPAVAVVSQQYCAPHDMILTVTKKVLSLSNGDFVVTDVNGGVLMKVRGRLFSFRERRVLHDTNGNSIICMRRKILSLRNRWNVFKGDSSDSKDFLFTVKEPYIFQWNTKLDVFLAGNTAERTCDFKVKGTWLERSCTFYQGDTIIALMRRRYTVENVLLGKDTFSVTVCRNVDYAFVIAIIVMLDAIHS